MANLYRHGSLKIFGKFHRFRLLPVLIYSMILLAKPGAIFHLSSSVRYRPKECKEDEVLPGKTLDQFRSERP